VRLTVLGEVFLGSRPAALGPGSLEAALLPFQKPLTFVDDEGPFIPLLSVFNELFPPKTYLVQPPYGIVDGGVL